MSKFELSLNYYKYNMKYIVYKIINELDNKIYIGCHKTEDINDRYMGSGLHLKRAQEKHGIKNFTKEILEIFDTSEEMFNHESILVDEEFIKRADTYNLKQGGLGGWDYINENRLGVGFGDNFAWYIEKLKDPDFVIENSSKLKKHFDDLRKQGKIPKGFLNKSHTEETKKSISKNVSGEKNGSYGTIWIFHSDEKKNKKIQKDKLIEYENLGWVKGRKLNF